MIAIPVLLIPAALIALTLWSWRGRRVDDHPICRKCGFDLTGKPDTSPRCPECGADLTRRRAIRIGNRSRRPVIFAASLSSLFVCVLVLGTTVFVIVRGVDLYPHLPLFLLRHELRGGSPGRAWDEIQHRDNLDRFSGSERLSIADALLDRQRDRELSWDEGFGDYLVSLRAAGKLDEARFRRFVGQMFEVTVVTGQAVYDDDVLPVRMKLSPRGPTSPPWFIRCEPRLTLAGQEVFPGGTTSETSYIRATAQQVNSKFVLLYPKSLRDLPAGRPLSAHLDIRFAVIEPFGEGSAEPVATFGHGPDHLIRVFQREPFCHAVRTPEVATQVRKAVKSVKLRGQPDSSESLLDCEFDPMPENYRFRMSLLVNGTELSSRTRAIGKGEREHFVWDGLKLPKITPPLKVVFTARPPDPMDSPNMRTYADVSFTVDDVPVGPKP